MNLTSDSLISETAKSNLERERDIMKLHHIKDLLLITCHFNTSQITHTFSINDSKDTLSVKCIKETFILEITTSESHAIEYHLSIDDAAESLFNKIHSI